MDQETTDLDLDLAAAVDLVETSGDDAGELVEELLIEEISIDGMCGVY